MKNLLILRHAKSSWKDPSLGDHDRPLNKRGKSDAPRMGELLRKEGLVPDLIMTSSAKRAQSTAEAAASACGYEGTIQIFRSLYHGGTGDYFEALAALKDRFQKVLVVGHNPGMEDLLEELTGYWERFPTAALAHISFPVSSWKGIDQEDVGNLENLWRPKELLL